MIFSEKLINWHKINKRQLPWKETNDAYKIWVSEIILQQTRVAQGYDYYVRFISLFPTVQALAAAPLDEVLKAWQGLGYYSRARNMHTTANNIVEHYNSKFPKSFDELKKLKGIGDYTAAAIASFAFKIPVAAIDGNALRVFSRVFGIFTPIDSTPAKKEFQQLGQELIDKQYPDLFNQAIMDFGATVCTPKKAQCDTCPFADTCYALNNNCIDQLPVKSKKTAVRARYLNYLLIKQGNNTYIRQRTAKDIWQMLYEFPLIETVHEALPEELMSSSEWQQLLGNSNNKILTISPVIKHQLSHQSLYTRFYIIEAGNTLNLTDQYLKISIKLLHNYSIPRLIDSYLLLPETEKYLTSEEQ